MKGTYGDYRSRRENRDWAGAWIAANRLGREDEKEAALRDWWLTSDLEAVAGQVVWCGHTTSDVHPALWWLDEGGWRLRFEEQDDHDLATFVDLDLQPLQKAWARGLALQALDLWGDWAVNANAPRLKEAVGRALLLHLDGSDQAEAERLMESAMNVVHRRYEAAFQRAHSFELGIAHLELSMYDAGPPQVSVPIRRTPEAQLSLEEAEAAWGAKHAANAIWAVVSSTPVRPPRFPDRCAARTAAEGLAAAKAALEESDQDPDVERVKRGRLTREYNLQWTIIVLKALRSQRLI